MAGKGLEAIGDGLDLRYYQPLADRIFFVCFFFGVAVRIWPCNGSVCLLMIFLGSN